MEEGEWEEYNFSKYFNTLPDTAWNIENWEKHLYNNSVKEEEHFYYYEKKIKNNK